MKCLKCNEELKIGMKVCPNCGTEINEPQNETMKKEDTFSNKLEQDKDNYRTIVLLKNQLDSIRKELDEDEKEENKAKKNKRNNKASKIKDKTQDLENENKSKKIGNVNQHLENDNKTKENQAIESIQLPMLAKKDNSTEKVVDERKSVDKKTEIDKVSNNIDEEVEKSAPIDRIADVLAGEIVDGINSYNDRIDKENTSDLEKTKEFNLDLEKTVAIKSLGETKELDKFSLIDDINRQIEITNEEAIKKEDNSKNGVEVSEEKIIQTEKNDEKVEVIGTRKKVFFFTGIAMIILLFTLVALWVITEINDKNNGTRIDYITRIDEALQHYYETENIDDILYVLEDVKNNKEEIKKVQSKTRSICDSWVLLYLNENVEDKVSFEKATDKYKGLLEGLYRYAIVKNDTNLVRALTEKDYNDLLIQFDNIYSDSTIFYEALELYNEKDYNKAFYMLDQIESTNAYYEKSVTYCNLIISDIIDILNNDIKKLEANIDSLDNAKKLEVYSKIEQIIIYYNSAYSNIDLNQNDEYQEILSKYTSKVSEYTDKVLNETNSQGSVT